MNDRHEFSRRIAKMGERKVTEWASSLGWVASPPDEDIKGWDFLLEFDVDRDGSLDERPAGFSCRVQVKSTASNKRAVNIKLDNWERMVKDPDPWFCLIFHYTADQEDPDLKAAYLVHIDQEHIERVLRRLRELGPSEQGLLHKHEIALQWGPSHRIRPLKARGFEKAIMTHCGNSPVKYRNNKDKIVSGVGYDKFRFSINMQISSTASEPVEQCLVDAVLGLGPDLDIRKATISESRFGIALEKSVYHDTRVAFATSGGSAPRASITFIDMDTYESAVIHGEYLSSEMFLPQLADGFHRSLIRSKFCEIVESPGKSIQMLWNWTPKDGSRPTIIEMGTIAKAMRLFSRAREGKLRLKVDVLGQKNENIVIANESHVDEEFKRKYDIWESAYWLARRLDMDLGMQVSPEHFIGQGDVLIVQRAILQSEYVDDIRADFLGDCPESGFVSGIVGVVKLSTSQEVFFCLYTIVGVSERDSPRDDGRSAVVIRKPRVRVHKEGRVPRELGTDEFMSELRDEGIRVLESQSVDLILPM